MGTRLDSDAIRTYGVWTSSRRASSSDSTGSMRPVRTTCTAPTAPGFVRATYASPLISISANEPFSAISRKRRNGIASSPARADSRKSAAASAITRQTRNARVPPTKAVHEACQVRRARDARRFLVHWRHAESLVRRTLVSGLRRLLLVASASSDRAEARQLGRSTNRFRTQAGRFGASERDAEREAARRSDPRRLLDDTARLRGAREKVR